MMNPQSSEMEQSKHDVTPVQYSVDCTTEVEAGVPIQAGPGRRNGDTLSSSPESDSLNGDAKRSGKSRRRRKRSARPETHCPATVETEDQESGQRVQTPSPGPSTVLLGLRSECASVWFDHRVYEQAESVYQCWLARASLLPTEALPASGLSVCPVPPAGGHSKQVACPHGGQKVSVHEPPSNQAESSVAEAPQLANVPNTLSLSSGRPAPPSTPDEGYLSLAPTPATPTQQTAPAPSPPQPINGLPRIPVELLGDVWLEKPVYDRAEAAFYQSLYGNNNLGASPPRGSCPSSPSTSRGSDYHPQSLEEEEEEEEEEEKPGPLLVAHGKAEVFHALHPIQEEEEPGDITKEEALVGGACYFLHPDSERVWLDKWRYDAAEGRFHGALAVEGAGGRRDTGPAAALACPKLLGDKYDLALGDWSFPKAH